MGFESRGIQKAEAHTQQRTKLAATGAGHSDETNEEIETARLAAYDANGHNACGALYTWVAPFNETDDT